MSMNQTSEKNERKKTRLGMKKKEVKQKALPTGWREVRLKNVASVKTGPFGAQLHQHDYVQSNGTPIITVEHLSERGLIHKNLPLVSDHDKERLNQYLIQEGDIVFSRVGSVDRSTLVSKDEVGWLFSGRLLRVRPKKCDVHSSYLNYFFHAQKFRHHMQSIAVGGTMPSINTSILSNVIIHLPPMNEQKAIASLLETWDTAIEKTEALIAAKEKRFKWLLKTLIHDQQNNPEWRKVKLGKVCTLEYGKPLKEQWRKDGKYPVFGSNGIVGYHNEYLITGPFIIVGRKGSAGMVQYSIGDGFPIDTTFYIKAQKRQICLLFLYYLLLELNLKKVGLQSGVPGLNRNDAHRIKIQLPSLSEQKRIANMLDTAKQEISLLEQIAEQYRTQKRGLMQKLLTGEWQLLPSFPRKRESRNLS